MTDHQPRIHAGLPTGGRFTNRARLEPATTLQPPIAGQVVPLTPDQLAERAQHVWPVAEQQLSPGRAAELRAAAAQGCDPSPGKPLAYPDLPPDADRHTRMDALHRLMNGS